jgi:hypothetical protein
VLSSYKGDIPLYQTVNASQSVIGHWEISILLASNSAFESIQNPAHHLTPRTFKKNGVYFASFEASIPLNKDFVLYFRNELINTPQDILAEHPNYKNDYVISVSFFPELNSLSVADVKEYYQL